MKLTQEQLAKLMREESLNIEALNEWAIKAYLNVFNKAYALGIVKGKAVGAAEMRERCAKVCRDLPNGGYCGYGNDGEDYADAILKETT